MSAAEFKRARAASAAMRECTQRANEPPKPINKYVGEVVPFPAHRQRRLVDAEFKSVRDYEGIAAYRWLSGVVRRHRTRLAKLGIASNHIEADVANLEAAFGLTNNKVA